MVASEKRKALRDDGMENISKHVNAREVACTQLFAAFPFSLKSSHKHKYLQYISIPNQ